MGSSFAAPSFDMPDLPEWYHARIQSRRISAKQAADDGKAFAIVIDAGSTGSRLHVYTWKPDSSEHLPANLSTPVEETQDTYSVKPGIGSDGGLDALQKLLDYAQQNTTLKDMKDLWPDIPIFLKATAGMRILPRAKRESIMTQVRDKLKATGFEWVCSSQARVISGEEEGVFGWITVNALQKRLQPGHIHSLADTVGAMDLGGASTQITFRPQSPDILAGLFNLQLGMQINEDLYTHSFLYFGQNEAIRRLLQVSLY